AKDPEAAREAIKAFDNARVRLKELDDRLRNAAPFGNRTVGAFMQQVHDYALASAAFFETFGQALQRPDDWQEAQREALDDLWQRVTRLWVRLRTSPVYDRLTGLRDE